MPLLFPCKEEVIKDPPSIFDVPVIEEVYYSEVFQRQN